MKVITTLEQGSKEWHDARMCVVTGSKLKRVMGTKEAYWGLIAELIAELVTEQSKIVRPTAEMERGNEEEVFAVKEFENRTGIKTVPVGICFSDKFEWLAVSPDRLIPDKNGNYTKALEVKCPDSKNAILYRLENTIDMLRTGLKSITAKGVETTKATAPFCGIPAEYKWQCIQYFLVIEELETLFFSIYDGRINDENSILYTIELHRTDILIQEAIQEAEDKLVIFREDWLEAKEIISPTNF